MTSGVYYILAPSGHRYIGSSVDIQRRFRTHRAGLRTGKHSNKALQSAWNKYGADLAFVIAEECAPDTETLLATEQRHIDSFDFRRLYNGNPIAGSTKGAPRNFTARHRENLRQAMLGREYSEEARANMSKAASLRKATPTTRANISKALKGRKPSDKAVAALKERCTGVPLTDAHRAKLSSALRRNSRSGFPGVNYHAQSGKWRARATLAGVRVNLGAFETFEAACAARMHAVSGGTTVGNPHN